MLGDPEWDKHEVRLAMIRLRANIRHEYAGKAKILTWHANQMRTEAARLRAEYPAACQEMDAELTALDLEAQRGLSNWRSGSGHCQAAGIRPPLSPPSIDRAGLPALALDRPCTAS